METVIKVNESELNDSLLKKLKNLISDLDNPKIEIHITEGLTSEFFKKLDASIKQSEEGKVISFTMDELSAHLSK